MRDLGLTATLKQIKDTLVVVGALGLGAGAAYAALEGLLRGAVFCLLCRRNSAPVPFADAPGLFIVSELMLLGLGAVVLAAACHGWRELRAGRDAPADDAPPAPRPSRGPTGAPAAAKASGAARNAIPGTRPEPPSAGTDRWLEPARSSARSSTQSSTRWRAAARPRGGWRDALVHTLALLCMLGTVAALALALSTRHDASDLSFAVLLVWLLPVAPFVLGCVCLSLSSQPAVARTGRWLLLAPIGAAFALALLAKLAGH